MLLNTAAFALLVKRHNSNGSVRAITADCFCDVVSLFGDCACTFPCGMFDSVAVICVTSVSMIVLIMFILSNVVFPKHKLQFPGHQVSWVRVIE